MIVDAKSFVLPTVRAPFIVFEGVNGAGKSTLINALEVKLRAAGRRAVKTFEPGNTTLGKSLRQLLLSGSDRPSLMSEVLLFAADRAEHVERVIKPALESGTIVLCDRFRYSTEAFQGYGREVNLQAIRAINDIATDGLTPDLTVLLDLEPAAGLARAKKRSEGEDAFEAEELAFHGRVRKGFLELASSSRERWIVLDATEKPEALQSYLQRIVGL